MGVNIVDAIRETADAQPDHPALIEGQQVISYRRMIERVDVLVGRLVQAGVGNGMGVGVMGHNSAEFICHALAVMQCGAVVLPVSHNLKADELERLCRSTGLHLLWDDRIATLPEHWEMKAETQVEEGWRLTRNPFAVDGRKLLDHVEGPALIRFTSGTTGTAKGVIISHTGIIERIAAANRKLNLGPGDTVIWVLSMAYHFVVSIVLYLRYGATICICSEFLADVILDDIERCKGTFLYASPMHIRMLAGDRTERQMDSVHTVISTSTGISARDCRAFFERYGKPVSQAYGIIEIGLPILNDTDSVGTPEAVGYALPDYEVSILDANGEVLPDGEIGHLAIRGPGMFSAYLDPPIVRQDVLRHGYFLTGDLATKDDGLIQIAGRRKSMINVSGNKVFPEEVEEVLNAHPEVVQSRVSGYAHPILTEGVQAEVVLMPGARIEQEELISYCRKRLSMYKVPQRITVVSGLPMTDSGKIIRHSDDR